MTLRKPPSPDQPHTFRPRSKGSRLACQLCGATEYDPIHAVPQRRIEDKRRKKP